MPVEVLCGSCHAKLRVPETALGRKVKCPKCNTVFEARKEEEPEVAEVEEAEEEVKAAPSRKRRQEADEDEERPAKKRPRDEDEDEDEDRPRNKKKGRRDDEDEEDDRPSKKRRRDEDEDEDDRPRGKKGRRDEDEDEEDEDDRPSKKRAKKAKGGKGLIIGLAAGGGGLLLIGIILLLVFLVGGGGGGDDSGCMIENWNQLKFGMSQAEAEKILGKGHVMTEGDVDRLYKGMPLLNVNAAKIALTATRQLGITTLWWKKGEFSIELHVKDGMVISGESRLRQSGGGHDNRALGMRR